MKEKYKCPLCNKTLSIFEYNIKENRNIVLINASIIDNLRVRRAAIATRLRECRSIEKFVTDTVRLSKDYPLYYSVTPQ